MKIVNGNIVQYRDGSYEIKEYIGGRGIGGNQSTSNVKRDDLEESERKKREFYNLLNKIKRNSKTVKELVKNNFTDDARVLTLQVVKRVELEDLKDLVKSFRNRVKEIDKDAKILAVYSYENHLYHIHGIIETSLQDEKLECLFMEESNKQSQRGIFYIDKVENRGKYANYMVKNLRRGALVAGKESGTLVIKTNNLERPKTYYTNQVDVEKALLKKEHRETLIDAYGTKDGEVIVMYSYSKESHINAGERYDFKEVLEEKAEGYNEPLTSLYNGKKLYIVIKTLIL